MNLYLANGIYVGTQADARRLDKGFKPVAVPVDKEGLIAYLNALALTPPAFKPTAANTNIVLTPKPPQRDMNPEAVLSRMDGPPNIDSMIETICNSSGYPLKRFAGAVAVAFNNLAKGS